ncbi:methyl-accepting chemotaxis protein [Marinomonas mediterranea]|jgi:Methyl-accepting chemotaxis protein|uniref:Methyl-accepting chemotaxis sensory transducer n=1 Tax=Marinomonas mediterranea (strain ATCC 700492 / JCM 21426 / NBRC 103028 / MMB-1) TaxID=717774 RepID=F2JZ22_MARM1|nr:methyl-accepting chemotaxis protein [Marinomonas mediterranea]ADZ92000.1 methyl-accepting chemotaxis sensory transducer [Marinomonas mediterranea MMB-1]WCN18077.1 methyl-accepting chemotaxis protein [Marinomonas mediterranea MMB-1]
MFSNISFRVKLLTLLLTAILGFAIVTGVAFKGLNEQDASSVRFDTLTEVDKNLSSLVISIMKESEALSRVDDQSYTEFLERQQDKYNQFSATLADDVNVLVDSTAQDHIRQVAAGFKRYNDLMTQLLESKHKVGFTGSSGLRGEVKLLGEALFAKVSRLSLMKQAFSPVREAEKVYIFEPTKENKEAFDAAFSAFAEKVKKYNLEDRFSDAMTPYLAGLSVFDDATKQYSELQSQFTSASDALSSVHQSASAFMQSLVSSARSAAQHSSSQAKVSLLAVSIIVAVVAALMMMGIGRSVNNMMSQIIADLGKIKDGDLTAQLAVNKARGDDFDQLCGSVNEMTEGLGGVIGDVMSTTQDVNDKVTELNSAVSSITKSNLSVSQQTIELASSTQQISATISDISATTNDLSTQSNDTYDSAKKGAETINDALSNLSNTIDIVNRTSVKLNELGVLSKDIDDVIAMINDLANQTNLLALNAAIEAARAGEAGRGFSVVADEVRLLAEKTVEATSSITEIVNTIQSSTEEAITTMSSGQESLKAIEQLSENAGLAIREIEQNAQMSSATSNDMAQAVKDISQTVAHMNDEMDNVAQLLKTDHEFISSIGSNAGDIYEQVHHLDSKTRTFTI